VPFAFAGYNAIPSLAFSYMDFQRFVLRATVSRFFRGQLLALVCFGGLQALIGGFRQPAARIVLGVALTGWVGLCLAFPLLVRRSLRTLFAGEALLQWVYSRDDWARYVAQERALYRRGIQGLLYACPLLSILLGGLVLMALNAFGQPPPPLSQAFAIAARISLVSLPALAVMGFLFALPDPPPGPHAQPQAYVSRTGAAVGDRFTRLRPPLGVGYEPGAPGLMLFHGRTQPGRTGLLARVPVPQGQEAEAEALVQRLRNR